MEQGAGQASTFDKKAEPIPGPAAGPTIGPASACGVGGEGLGRVGLDVCGAAAAVQWRPPCAASHAQETQCGEQDVLTRAVGAARTWLSCDPVSGSACKPRRLCAQCVSASPMPASPRSPS